METYQYINSNYKITNILKIRKNRKNNVIIEPRENKFQQLLFINSKIKKLSIKIIINKDI